MKKLLMSCAAGIVLAGSAQVSQAVSVTFAQFQQATSGNQFTYTSGGIGASGTLSATAPVNFQFLSFFGQTPNFGALLNTSIAATLTITGTSSNLGGNTLNNGQTNFDTTQFTFTGTSGSLASRILLQGSSGNGPTANGGVLTAPNGAQSSTFNASNLIPGTNGTASPQFVRFSSQVINLAGITDQNFALSFSSDTPPNSYAGQTPPFLTPGFLNSFTAAGTGTFAANAVPEPGTVAFAGSLLIGSVFTLRRRRNRK